MFDFLKKKKITESNKEQEERQQDKEEEKKKKKKEKKTRTYDEIKVTQDNGIIKSWTVTCQENDPCPDQFKEMSDWFYYKDQRPVFSFKYNFGIYLIKKERIISINIERHINEEIMDL